MQKAAKKNTQSNAQPESPIKRALQQCKRAFIYAGIFSLATNFLMILLPIYSLQVLDRVMASRSLETLIVLTSLAIAAFLFYGVFSAVRSFILNHITEWLDVKLAPELFRLSVMRASLGFPTSGGQYQRDLMNIKSFISSGVAVLLDAPWSIIFILVIYMVNPVLGLLSVAGAVMLIGFAVLNEFATKKPIDDAQENSIQSMNIVETANRNAEAIEAMGMMDNVLNQWVDFNAKGLEKQYLAQSRGTIIQSVSRSLRMVIQIGVIGIGGWLALQGELTVGGMIAASILVGRALAPFEGAIGVWKNLVNARDSYHRLGHVLDNLPTMRGEMALPAPEGRLSVENIFYQPPGAPPILKGINFHLEPGEMLGIIGPSAAGKSTLSKLIIGVLPPNHGSIRLDGAETFKWNRADFGQYVGYMPQHVDLFAGTIKDNIARMQGDADPQQVIEAAKLAGCHDMILRLPKGYETEYSVGNQALSPGQRQRIGLARALYSRPRFLVLDEPNSNLDGEGERALMESLVRMKRLGITTIVVAHRPSIVGSVDKLLMLRNGTVESFGKRDEVLQKYTAKRPIQNEQQAAQGANDAPVDGSDGAGESA
ncbi:MAG: type I secretion system permease/ATPase [Rickettsiales bacterium]|nr:type I secretion system permease/ATPase [Rickettsiales bacterium]